MHNVILTGTNLNIPSGISTHLKQLFNTDLANKYHFIHFEVGTNSVYESKYKKIFRYFYSPIEFVTTVIKHKPSFVHFNTSMDFKGFFRDSIYLLFAKLLGVKTILQLHAGLAPDEFFNQSSFFYYFRKSILELSDAVILLTNNEYKHAKQFCNFKSLYVVPNALNNLNFSRRVKKINRDKTKLFFIGRLIETKGVAESIKALSILKDEGIENVILDIAGDGPFQEELKKISIELGVNNSCNFVGPIFDEQKNELWEASDILVFPTYFKEGLPYALLEALATGTPSITTAAGGIPEIIDDNIEGIIVEPKNALQVAEAIKYLIQNPDKYELMSIACLEKAQNKFSILNLANKIDNIYLSLL